MLSLWTTKKIVPEIALELSDPPPNILEMFGCNESKPYVLRDYVQHLTKLRLDLAYYSQGRLRRHYRLLRISGLSAYVSRT